MTYLSNASAPPSQPRVRRAASLALCLIGLLALATPSRAVQLVTAQEAALPPDQLPLLDQRNLTRLPSVDVVSPASNGGLVKSPLKLKLKIEAHGGAKIDPDSIVLTYRKTPEINITQRIMPYISAGGIEIPDAELPPGKHEFRITVKDSYGQTGAADFGVQVGP